jgi:hypothetical protein
MGAATRPEWEARPGWMVGLGHGILLDRIGYKGIQIENMSNMFEAYEFRGKPFI